MWGWRGNEEVDSPSYGVHLPWQVNRTVVRLPDPAINEKRYLSDSCLISSVLRVVFDKPSSGAAGIVTSPAP